MVLLLGSALALWIGVSVVVASLCVAAARGDQALLTADVVAAPAAPEAEIEAAGALRHGRVA